jgi:hypothetical protein
VFDLGGWRFAFDLKDGYWHCDLHEDMWEYMCFEWEGVVYTFTLLSSCLLVVLLLAGCSLN